MTKASPIVLSSSNQRIKKAACSIELLESRAYLSGVLFGPAQNTPGSTAGISPMYVNLDNISSSTNADLIVANVANGSVGNSISVLPGNGNGTFGTARNVPLDFSPLTILDGQLGTNVKADIVVGSTSGNQVGVILQANDGSLSETDLVASGLTNTQSVAIGDFNGDGHPDIAVASFDAGTTNNVAIFLNNGDGTFTLHQVLSVPHAHVASIAAFNAGGHLDLAVADAADNTVTVMTNDGGANFAPAFDYAVGSGPVTIKSGQFNLNNNNNDDLVTANSAGGSVSVLLGNGDGTFNTTAVNTAVAGVPSGGGPLKVRVSNLNNDGKPDLLGLLSSGSSGDAEVLLGNGDGTFHVGSVISTGGPTRNSIAAGDLNGDGLTDLVLADPTQVTSLINVTNQDHVPPTAVIAASQPALTVGASSIQFSVTYSDLSASGQPGQVDATTIKTGNVIVTPPTGPAQTATLVSTNLGNGPNVTATYQINPVGSTVSVADNGTYTVSSTSASSLAVADANQNVLAAATIGTFQVPQDTVAPSAVVNATQSIVTPGAATIQFSVTYTDPSTNGQPDQVNVATIKTGNLTVTPPTGPAQTAVLVSTNLHSASSVTAVYQINAKSGGVSTADNGTYTVASTASPSLAVADANGNVVAAGTIGTFHVGYGPLIVSNVVAKLPVSVVAGARSNRGARVTITNVSSATVKEQIVVNFYASPDGTISDNSPLLASVSRKVNLRTGKHVNVNLSRFTWPSSLNGKYVVVADIDLSSGTAASPNSVVVAPAFVDIQNLWNGKLPATLRTGKRVNLPILLKNLGNSPAKGTATLTVVASNGTTLTNSSIHLNLGAGKSQTAHAAFVVPVLPPGAYQLTVTVLFPGDTNAGNNVVTSPGTFTI